MDEFYQNVFKKVGDINFTYYWHENYSKDFNALYNLTGDNDSNENIAMALKDYIKNANNLVDYYPKYDFRELRSIEEDKLIFVVNSLVNKFKFETPENHINCFFDLLQSLKDQTRLPFFNGSVFSSIIFEMRTQYVIPQMDNAQTSKFLEMLEFRYYGNLKTYERTPDLESYEALMAQKWKMALSTSIEYLTDSQIQNSLPAVQKLFEFCLQNAAEKPDDPNKNICRSIIYKIDRRNDSIKLYHTITSNPELLVSKLDFFKDLLLNYEDTYYSSPVFDFISQLVKAISFEASKPNSVFETFYKRIYETILDVYAKAKRPDSRKVCRVFARDLKDLLEQMKRHDPEFQLWLINKLVEIAEIVYAYKEENKDKKDKESMVWLFADFCWVFEYYLRNYCKNKKLIGPTIRLIITLLKMNSESSSIQIASDMLNKENFFAFKDFMNDLLEIVNISLDLVHLLITRGTEEKETFRNYYDAIRKCIEYTSGHIKANPQLVLIVQNTLISNMLLKVVEENIDDPRYFDMIYYYIEILSFKTLKEDEINKFHTIIKAITSPGTIELMQEMDNTHYRRNYFYLKVFHETATLFEARTDIANLIEPEIFKMFQYLFEMDSFEDLINPTILSINFKIISSFVIFISKQNGLYREEIKILLSIFMKLCENHQKSNDIRNYIIPLFSYFNADTVDILATHASDLWKFYLIDDETKFIEVIKLIIPVSINTYLNEYSAKYTEFLVSLKNDVKLINHIGVLTLIAKHAPEWILGTKEGKGLLLELAQAGSQSYNMMYTVLNIFTELSVALSANAQEIFLLHENRSIVLNMLNLNENQDFIKMKNTFVGVNFAGIYYILATFYNNLLQKIKNHPQWSIEYEKIIKELKNIYYKIDNKDDYTYFISSFMALAINKNTKPLVEKEKIFFKTVEEECTGNVKQTAIYIIDLLEGRNLESIQAKFTENLKNIESLSNIVSETEQKLQNVTKAVEITEINVTNLKKDVGNINDKLVTVDERLDDQDKHLEVLDDKTLLNVPLWSRDIAPKLKDEWVLIAKRLNFTQKDINAWQTQADPFMAVLQEWYTINKSSDATNGLLKVLKELNKTECIQIIENSLNDASKTLNEEDDDTFTQRLVNSPPEIFISYQWAVKEKAELLKKYLEQSKYDCWLDIGQMGGGVIRNDRIDKGMRAAKVIVCFITSDYAKDDTAVKQLNLAVQLGKPVLPLLLEKLDWPPPGSVGPILSEYLFIRFFQKPKEKTNDERYWPVDKYDELIMQLKQLVPSKQTVPAPIVTNKAHPLVFISYQWDKQKQIIKLYEKLTSFGLTCWLDIKEMAGGDSLYEKIDTGIRNCNVVISCITNKYSLSANCRKEVSLANSVNKPLIPILLESGMAYPPKGPMGPVFATIDYVDFTVDINEQDKWNGVKSEELLVRIKDYIPDDVYNDIDSKIQVMKNSKACIIS